VEPIPYVTLSEMIVVYESVWVMKKGPLAVVSEQLDMDILQNVHVTPELPETCLYTP